MILLIAYYNLSSIIIIITLITFYFLPRQPLFLFHATLAFALGEADKKKQETRKGDYLAQLRSRERKYNRPLAYSLKTENKLGVRV